MITYKEEQTEEPTEAPLFIEEGEGVNNMILLIVGMAITTACTLTAFYLVWITG